jgi:hypothetical protein
VGRVVADQPQPVAVARRDDLHRALLERSVEIEQVPVLAHAQRGPGQPFADRPRRVGAGGAVGELEWRAVGKRDLHAR